MTEDADIRVCDFAGCLVVTVDHRLDVAAGARIHDLIADTGDRHVVVNLRSRRAANAETVTALIRLRDIVTAAGGSIHVVTRSGRLRDLAPHVSVYDDPADALEAALAGTEDKTRALPAHHA